MRDVEAAEELGALLQAASGDIAQAALLGASTAHRLAAAAHAQGVLIDCASDDAIADLVKRVQALTVAANHAAELGLNLLKANKELVAADEVPTPVAISFGVRDAKRNTDGG